MSLVVAIKLVVSVGVLLWYSGNVLRMIDGYFRSEFSKHLRNEYEKNPRLIQPQAPYIANPGGVNGRRKGGEWYPEQERVLEDKGRDHQFYDSGYDDGPTVGYGNDADVDHKSESRLHRHLDLDHTQSWGEKKDMKHHHQHRHYHHQGDQHQRQQQQQQSSYQNTLNDGRRPNPLNRNFLQSDQKGENGKQYEGKKGMWQQEPPHEINDDVGRTQVLSQLQENRNHEPVKQIQNKVGGSLTTTQVIEDRDDGRGQSSIEGKKSPSSSSPSTISVNNEFSNSNGDENNNNKNSNVDGKTMTIPIQPLMQKAAEQKIRNNKAESHLDGGQEEQREQHSSSHQSVADDTKNNNIPENPQQRTNNQNQNKQDEDNKYDKKSEPSDPSHSIESESQGYEQCGHVEEDYNDNDSDDGGFCPFVPPPPMAEKNMLSDKEGEYKQQSFDPLEQQKGYPQNDRRDSHHRPSSETRHENYNYDQTKTKSVDLNQESPYSGQYGEKDLNAFYLENSDDILIKSKSQYFEKMVDTHQEEKEDIHKETCNGHESEGNEGKGKRKRGKSVWELDNDGDDYESWAEFSPSTLTSNQERAEKGRRILRKVAFPSRPRGRSAAGAPIRTREKGGDLILLSSLCITIIITIII